MSDCIFIELDSNKTTGNNKLLSPGQKISFGWYLNMTPRNQYQFKITDQGNDPLNTIRAEHKANWDGTILVIR